MCLRAEGCASTGQGSGLRVFMDPTGAPGPRINKWRKTTRKSAG
jgi:hypothetical protein